MADLDFKHSVAGIPAGQEIKTYKGEGVKAEPGGIPNYQDSVNAYAENTNWLSKIGSAVATGASHAIATKLGSELGENPQGDLGPSLTEFDQNLEKSYNTQAQSTLGLQAQKLITQSNLELAAMPRINQETIAKSQEQIGQGLRKIFSLAPDAVRASMEHQYGSLMIQQNESLIKRMIGEQKEDRINTLDLATKVNNQNASSFSISGIDLDKDGNSKSAMEAVRTTERAYRAAVANKDKTPLEAKTAIDTARVSMLSGKYIRIGLQKEREGKLAEYQKELADNPPKDVSAEDHGAVYNNFVQYMNNQKALRADAENIASQEMHNKIALNPGAITDSEWSNFANSVSPLKAEQMRFNLIQALKTKQSEGLSVTDLLNNYGSAEVQANADPKIKNLAYNQSVASAMNANPTLTREQAQVQVAASAAAPAPVFTQTLKNSLWSGNATQMVSAARMIDDLQTTGSGHALVGLSAEDLAIASDIAHNNNPQDPAWAARMITENKENQDPAVRKISEAALNNLIHENTVKNNVSVDDYILSKFNMQGGLFHAGFDSPWLKSKYASDILSVFSTNYINTGRDVNRAEALTRQYITDNYGKTKFNGVSEWTKHPIEKAVGFSEGDGIPSINKDIIRQVSPALTRLKEAYDNNTTDTYWTIEPSNKDVSVVSNIKDAGSQTLSQLAFKNTDEKLQFVKHTRNGVATDTEKYPLRLVGNSFNWELNVETDHGPRSIFLEAPEIGVHKYTPDTRWIQNDYMGRSQNFPTEKYSSQLRTQLAPTEGDL